MRKASLALFAVGVLVFAQASGLRAGGALETVDITGFVPSPIRRPHRRPRNRHQVGCPFTARSLQHQHDARPGAQSLSARRSLTLADAQAAFTRSFNRWNTIPTSFIEMQLTSTTANLGLRGFDMVNELTFRTAATFTAIASSPSTSLIADSQFDDGDDIDGDGDSDVSASIASSSDVDNDGDFEFPAGFYKAGTILDNDVQFNTKTTNGFRFTVNDGDADINIRSVDLEGVATHEFGHSFGLSHTLVNQQSAQDPTGATMFPFIDTGDPASELSQRSPEIDDVAWASYFYPEGTATSGPAALQAGDLSFNQVFGLIRGTVTHGVQNEPLAGAHVFATDWEGRAVGVECVLGDHAAVVRPVNGRPVLPPRTGAVTIVNGDYVIPVPKGSYAVGFEPVDGSPVCCRQHQLYHPDRQLLRPDELQRGVLEQQQGVDTRKASREGEEHCGDSGTDQC